MTSSVFEWIVIFFIIISSVQLALTNPLNDPNGDYQQTLYWIDLVTTIVFFIECLMKIITYGFVTNGEPSYLKNPWNLLDLIISLISLSSITEAGRSL